MYYNNLCFSFNCGQLFWSKKNSSFYQRKHFSKPTFSVQIPMLLILSVHYLEKIAENLKNDGCFKSPTISEILMIYIF